MLVQVRGEAFAVLAPAPRVAEARESQPQTAHAQLVQQRGEQQDRLGVERGIVRSEGLGPDLPELAVAAGLGALVAKEAREVPELHRRGALVHPVLEVRAADRRGALGAQCERTSGAVFERVHLLLHDVGRLAHAASEELSRLERGRLDALVARGLEDRARLRLEQRAGGGLLGQDVVGAPRSLD